MWSFGVLRVLVINANRNDLCLESFWGRGWMLRWRSSSWTKTMSWIKWSLLDDPLLVFSITYTRWYTRLRLGSFLSPLMELLYTPTQISVYSAFPSISKIRYTTSRLRISNFQQAGLCTFCTNHNITFYSRISWHNQILFFTTDRMRVPEIERLVKISSSYIFSNKIIGTHFSAVFRIY